MKQIDHEPNERRPGWTIWWVAWGIVVALWAVQFARHGLASFDWDQIALGGLTVGVLVIWATEITGNKVPESWRRKRGD